MSRERLVKTFCEFVQISSESGNEKNFLLYLKNILEKESAKVIFDNYGNMIAKFEAKNSNKKESVLFSSHADTVKPGNGIEPYEDNGKIRARGGKTVLGADDKGGIVIILEAIRMAKKHPPIEFVITVEEEIGLHGSCNLDYSLINSKIGFVLDSSLPEDILRGGPSIISFDVKYKGKAAHAGVEPEKGISSIQAASLAISKMRLGRIDEETTANIGIINGGVARNAIPETTEIIAECRSKNHQKCLKLAEEMKNHFEKAAEEVRATVNIEQVVEYSAYRLDDNNVALQIAQKAIEIKGLKPNPKIITGGTDAAHLNGHGISTVVIGVGMHNEHTSDEYLDIEEAQTMREIVITIMGLIG